MTRGLGWARGVGFIAGATVALVAVLAWRVPAGTGTLGSDVILATAPTGELAVSKTGPFLTAPELRPGAEANAPSGTVKLYNRTAQTIAISVVAMPSDPDLDRLLWIELEVGGVRAYRGSLGDLREGAPTFTLEPQVRAILTARAWLPSTVTTGYEGRVVNVDLTYEAEAVSS